MKAIQAAMVGVFAAAVISGIAEIFMDIRPITFEEEEKLLANENY